MDQNGSGFNEFNPDPIFTKQFNSQKFIDDLNPNLVREIFFVVNFDG